MAFAEVVRRGALPWTPGQVHQIRLEVPAKLEDGAETVEVAIPAQLVRDALKKRKGADDELENGAGETKTVRLHLRKQKAPDDDVEGQKE